MPIRYELRPSAHQQLTLGCVLSAEKSMHEGGFQSFTVVGAVESISTVNRVKY